MYALADPDIWVVELRKRPGAKTSPTGEHSPRPKFRVFDWQKAAATFTENMVDVGWNATMFKMEIGLSEPEADDVSGNK